MSHRERILTAMNLGEPDMVPITDLALDPPIIEQITGMKLEGFSFSGGSRGKDGWINSKKPIILTKNPFLFNVTPLCSLLQK